MTNMLNNVSTEDLKDKAKACLLGGALGDALGAPVEFMSQGDIFRNYGEEGIQELDEAYGFLGAITDDTQMTLFSAEGCIRAQIRGMSKGICHVPTVVAYAYQRWLHTQGEKAKEHAISEAARGWLLSVPELYERRAPGVTCISALRIWDQQEAANDSKGCGTVMRSAPFGFFPYPWETAWECAAITHGHIEAKVSSAIFASAIEEIISGTPMREALLAACDKDRDKSLSSELVRRAVKMAESATEPDECIVRLGEGWVAEEALAVGAYCALKANGQIATGLRMAVNHGGDSDSTGSICGNLMGAAFGMGALPASWLDRLELRSVIEQVAADMIAVRCLDGLVPDEAAIERMRNRYPGV